MTGKEMIMYILQNNLENEPIFKEDGTFVEFVDENELASKFGVGVSTIRLWSDHGRLEGFKNGDSLLFMKNATDPRDALHESAMDILDKVRT